MSDKQNQISYSALVREAVQDSSEPVTFDEIMQYVGSIRPIATRSPKQTIRNAVSQCRLIANTGDGKYGWYPRLITGSRMRVSLDPSHLKLRRIIFDRDVQDLVWPARFGVQTSLTDGRPVDLQLPNGVHTSFPLDFFGEGYGEQLALPSFGNG